MGLINYSYYVIGDCNNTSEGVFSLSFTASSPPLSVTWINPVSGLTFSSQTITEYPYGVTGLTAGTYSLELKDTAYLESGNTTTIPITFVITSSCTVTLTSQQNTTCGNNNGAAYAYMPINYSNNTVYLYFNGELVQSGTTNSNYMYFTNLAPGVYYVTAYDMGGCYGTSNSIIILPSTQLDFSLYAVNNPACVTQNGQIYITSVSGTGPYSYSWSDEILSSVTGTSVTGLTQGNYGVTVTDSLGCSATKSISISNSSPLSVISYTTILPTCYTSNGSLTFYISGGSSPYNYTLSNGEIQILISSQVTFTGLTSGNYTLTVTDAGLCQTNFEAVLYTPNSFSVISTTKKDVFCNQLGSITTSLQGGTPPYFYSLSANTGSITNRTTSLLTNTFSDLYYGDYLVSVRDINSACTYTETINLVNNTNFSISITSNTATCNINNGSVTVGIYDEFQPNLFYTYYLSSGQRSTPTTATSYTFSGLLSGIYTATVIDNTTCTVTAATFVGNTEPYDVFLYPTDCIDGNSGTISALIPENDGPYNLIWSPNVNGQTGIFVTGLTAGTYSLTVSGDGNCNTTRSVEVTCNPKQTTSYSFKYSTGVKEIIPTTKLTLRNMMYSGYTSLVENATNCSLSSATFNFKVDIGGTEYEFPFYYTESFDNIPDLNYFAPIIEDSIIGAK